MSHQQLARNALCVALCAVATLLIRIPVPATQGYINLGDTLIFVSALLFGPRTGGIAGGLGSAMADILAGYAHWAPLTFLIKGIEGILVGSLFRGPLRGPAAIMRGSLAVIAGGLWMILGYFLAATGLYGWQPALAAIPGNILQALSGLILSLPIAVGLIRAGVPRSE
ncbi:MAG: ECF transporter S component [bacterium]|nr:ECF transporter S component [bacterium]